jgi:regulator of sigma E protease
MGLVEYVRPRPGEQVTLLVEREGGERQSVDVTLGRSADDASVGYLGAGARPLPAEQVEALWSQQRYGPVSALRQAAAKTWEMTALTAGLFGRMLFGDVSVQNLSGPINIAVYAGDTFRSGFVDFVRFLAVVSISLGLINLIPVPMLDGGQIVFTAIEGLRGAPLSDRIQVVGQQVGIVAVLMLMSVALYNDLARLFG